MIFFKFSWTGWFWFFEYHFKQYWSSKSISMDKRDVNPLCTHRVSANEIHCDCQIDLTHFPSAAYMHPSVNWVSIGSGNGLSPGRCQAITWTNAGLLSIGPLGPNLCEVWIKIKKLFSHENASKNVVCKMAVILPRGRWVRCIVTKYYISPQGHMMRDGIMTGKTLYVLQSLCEEKPPVYSIFLSEGEPWYGALVFSWYPKRLLNKQLVVIKMPWHLRDKHHCNVELGQLLPARHQEHLLMSYEMMNYFKWHLCAFMKCVFSSGW